MIVVIYYPDSTTHLAMALTGLGEKNTYISFFPANGSVRAAFRLHGYQQDKSHGIGKMVILPTEESCGYGLSEKAIYEWWKNEFIPYKESFSWFTNNCSSIVYRALCAGQSGSATLNHTVLKVKKGMCMPSKIIDYASELGGQLVNNEDIEKNLFLKFAELKECCEFGKLGHAYQQVTAIFIRLKHFSKDNKYQSILDADFCTGIANALAEFKDIQGTQNDSSKLNELTDCSSITEINIETYFMKLQNLAEFICALNKNNDKESNIQPEILLKTLQDVLVKHVCSPLLNKINEFNNQHAPKTLTKNTDMASVRPQLAAIEDKNNPHGKYIATSEDEPYHHLGYGYTRM